MKSLEAFEKFVGVLKSIPSDIHALNMLVLGAVLAIKGHSEQASLVIGGALAILKGHQTPTA